MKSLFKIASGIRRVYYFIVRPKTIGVKCLIECNGEYLFIKQTYGSHMSNWNLPGGGVERGESVESAVAREVFEEVGIVLSEVAKVKKYVSNFEYKVDTVHCFYAKVVSKHFVINTNEISEAVWFPKNNIPENISRSIKESLISLLK